MTSPSSVGHLLKPSSRGATWKQRVSSSPFSSFSQPQKNSLLFLCTPAAHTQLFRHQSCGFFFHTTNSPTPAGCPLRFNSVLMLIGVRTDHRDCPAPAPTSGAPRKSRLSPVLLPDLLRVGSHNSLLGLDHLP